MTPTFIGYALTTLGGFAIVASVYCFYRAFSLPLSRGAEASIDDTKPAATDSISENRVVSETFSSHATPEHLAEPMDTPPSRPSEKMELVPPQEVASLDAQSVLRLITYQQAVNPQEVAAHRMAKRDPDAMIYLHVSKFPRRAAAALSGKALEVLASYSAAEEQFVNALDAPKDIDEDDEDIAKLAKASHWYSSVQHGR